MSRLIPRVGATVHYTTYPTPEVIVASDTPLTPEKLRQYDAAFTEPIQPICRAAIITEVDDGVSLAVFEPNGTRFHRQIHHDPTHSLHSWHWPHHD